MEESERSFAKIEESDLERLALLSREDRDEFFSRQPRWQQLYANRLLCVTLCQVAAVHYVDGRYGVKDFDIWTFTRSIPTQLFPGDVWAERTTAFKVRKESGRCWICRKTSGPSGEIDTICIRLRSSFVYQNIPL